MSSPNIPPAGALRRCSAFTLSETLIAAAIISGAMLSVIGLFSTSLNLGRQSAETTAAAMIARRISEEVSLSHVLTSLSAAASGNVRVYDSSLAPLPLTDGDAQHAYQHGSSQINAAYLVRWQIIQRTDLGANISALVIHVESPADVAALHRKAYRYATLIRTPFP